MESTMIPFEDLPPATHEGMVTLAEDIVLPCAVLEGGTRLLTQTEFVKAIGRRGSVKKGEVYSRERGVSVPVFLSARNLQPFISDKLLLDARPIQFRTTRKQRSVGYRAELLPAVCNVFLDARDAGALVSSQESIADRCRLLMRAYATVGIIALVDEATGYQAVRVRNALEQILARFLSDHRLEWAKTFPDEFYIEMFRLRGWKYEDLGFRSRPPVVGHFTNDIIYERLAPGVLERLKELNPRGGGGARMAKHHQWLSSDYGVPELRNHLSGVLALMRAAPNWRVFMSLVNRSFPKPGQQLELPLEE